MLNITKKTEYAFIALACLAKDNYANAKSIARRFDLSASLMSNVMKQLRKSGVISSVRGTKGGYVLNGTPGDISLERILGATEDIPAITKCAEGVDGCHLSGKCPIQPVMLSLHTEILSKLKEITVADVVDNVVSDLKPKESDK